MQSSQDPFIMIVDIFIFKNNLTPSPCFTFIPKTGIGLPETGVRFCSADASNARSSSYESYF